MTNFHGSAFKPMSRASVILSRMVIIPVDAPTHPGIDARRRAMLSE